MLDSNTKRKIDDCRDILVGKLPDPKAQIEQITIALIYKFMDDIDKEAVELGGELKFFTDFKLPDPQYPEDRSKDKLIEFQKYAWGNLNNPKVTASELLSLYSEAIGSMDKNPNIPQLFRDIFKNAYLPYRDPETLKMFLKTIGEFEYSHSEKLGDAFEYLLSVMGSQGDAGQFRTPRHIIDFLVACVNPSKTDTILDPACGTAGFLISAYKYIQEQNEKGLTPDERKKLIQNFVGYDISPDMVRLSLVNLYLHGFSDPHIWEYDTLSSEDRWNESFDVILANPPFMSPKGGIRPHKKFTISSNRSEVLFVDYIAEHLNPKGRAGIIVPEGVIFQSGTAYKELRKMLVDNYLYAVVSLPAGVFNPYSGVKTSILLMDKDFAKKTNNILFVKIENDGFGLGAQRNAVKGGQLKEAVEILDQFKAGNFSESTMAHAVPKSEIAKNGDYNLSGERYKIEVLNHSNFPIVRVEDVSNVNPLKSEIKELSPDTEVSFVPMADLNENQIGFEAIQIKKLEEVYNGYTYFKNDDVLIAKVTPCFENGKAGVAKNLKNGIGFGSSEFYVLRANKNIKPAFLYRLLSAEKFKDYAISKMTGTGGLRRVPKNVVAEFQIPLPPLSIQEEIVAEIEGYQKIIDGAKAVVENYKPKIDIDPDWEMVELGEVCEIKRGRFSHRPRNAPEFYGGEYPFIQTGDVVKSQGGKVPFTQTLNELGLSVSKLFKPTIVLITIAANIGDTGILDYEACFTDSVVGLIPNSKVNAYYLELIMRTQKKRLNDIAPQAAQKNINIAILKEVIIPIAPIEIQLQIVAQIEKEQALVNANKELIEIFEQKIKDRIAKVWGEEKKETKAYKVTEGESGMVAENEIIYK